MTTNELLKVAQLSLTNKALAARLRVMRAYMKDRLSELDREELQLAADRLEMLENPTPNEINRYFQEDNSYFEPPIDNEL